MRATLKRTDLAEIARAGREQPRPVEGFYRIRLEEGAAWSPARIYRAVTPDPWFPDNPMDRSPTLHGDIRGRPASAVRIFSKGERITEEEHHHLVRLMRWARAHAPDSPEANPRQRVDINRLPPIT